MANFREFLEGDAQRRRIVARIPGGAPFFDLVVQEIIDAAEVNPKIKECEPRSIIRAVCRAVSWGLIIGETAFLIPRAKRRGDQPMLTALQGYKGKIEIMVRHGVALRVDAFPVYEKEAFEFGQGSSPFVRHLPILDPHSRGPLVGAYACATIRWAAPPKLYVMHREEIDAIRVEYSQQWGEGSLDDIPWYGPVRCVHQLSKQMPMQEKVRQLLTDDADDHGIEAAPTTSGIVPGSADEKRLLGAGPAATITAPVQDALAIMRQGQVA